MEHYTATEKQHWNAYVPNGMISKTRFCEKTKMLYQSGKLINTLPCVSTDACFVACIIGCFLGRKPGGHKTEKRAFIKSLSEPRQCITYSENEWNLKLK